MKHLENIAAGALGAIAFITSTLALCYLDSEYGELIISVIRSFIK